MILGIGTDIVGVARMRAVLARHGERFARRILAAAEFEEYLADKRPAYFLAKHFAAKEALVKALGTGFRDGIRLSDIRVTHDHLGKPGLRYDGNTAALLRQMGISCSHISLADEHDYAVAFVILEAGGSKA
ncbi:MAG: holo-ACP synthase [Gammaproteobacteria bacterium]